MITAYASANTNPTQSQADKTLAQSALTTSTILYGGAVDSEDGSASFSFSWSIVGAPSGHGASLVNSAIQNPTLQTIDTWGNYRLFLIATNTSTGQTSEDDPVRAPNSAFVTVRVNSTNRTLQKPAKTERDWHTHAHAWVSAIENTSVDDLDDVSFTALATNDLLRYDGTNWVNGANLTHLGDVTISNPSNTQVLRYNGNNWENGAEAVANIRLVDSVSATSATLNTELGDLNVASSDSNLEFNITTANNDLTLDLSLADNVGINGDLTVNGDNGAVDSKVIFKRGDGNTPNIMYDQSESTFSLSRDGSTNEVIMTQGDVPTQTVRGGVLLSGTANTTGKILDVERLIFTGGADQTVEGKTSGVASIYDTIRCVDGTGGLGTSASNHSHVIFRNKTGFPITLTNITVLLLDSGTVTTDDYEFALVTYASTGNMVSNTITSTDDLGAITRTTNYKTGYIEATSTRTVASGAYFGIKCTQETDGSHLGHGLRVTIEATRSI